MYFYFLKQCEIFVRVCILGNKKDFDSILITAILHRGIPNVVI